MRGGQNGPGLGQHVCWMLGACKSHAKALKDMLLAAVTAGHTFKGGRGLPSTYINHHDSLLSTQHKVMW